MNGDISIDLGSAIPYTLDKILSLFGKDTITVIAREKLQNRINVAAEEAAMVQCVGMEKPIPLRDIYQPTRLRKSQYDNTSNHYSFADVMRTGTSACFWGGPGTGKSMLMRWAFLSLLGDQHRVPILFTLRAPGAVQELSTFVQDLGSSRVVKSKADRVILLVDGYDEINFKAREVVSKALKEFQTLDRGNFYLTCRLYYDLIDLPTDYFFLEPFDITDARKYCATFFVAYRAQYDVDELLEELVDRGFSDFLSSPLMLALVCILKTGPLPHLPKNTIGLIRRALDTLTFRWDESKGIARDHVASLDGEERIRCLMRIAYTFRQSTGSESMAISAAEQHLKFLQRTDISVARLLQEIAQWYGVFVPTSEGQWSFAHRTVHDFLAARFWVESGRFSVKDIPSTEWNARVAYAACLTPDATAVIVKSLQREHELYILIECLSNNAPFRADEVARALIKRCGVNRFANTIYYEKTGNDISVSLKHDFLRLVSDKFLDALAHAGVHDRTRGHNAMYCLALGEMKRRGKRLQLIERPDLSNCSIHVKRAGEAIEVFSPVNLL